MENSTNPFKEGEEKSSAPVTTETITNPFADNQSIEKDDAQLKIESDKEQQFKEAQRERD